MKDEHFIEKLNQTGLELRQVLRAFVYNEKVCLEAESWKNVFWLAKKHSVAAVLSDVAEQNGCPRELTLQWQKVKNSAVRKSLLFSAEREEIFAVLDSQNVKYLPLKGVILCEYYPQPSLREFADNDVYFLEKDKQKVYAVMEQRGYKAEGKLGTGVHDAFLKPPVFNFEWHRKLLSDTVDGERRAYFEEVLQTLPVDERGKWYMRSIDFYLYFLAHLEKHFSGSGCGLRSFLDLYFLDKELLPEIEKGELERKLQQIHLTSFYSAVENFNRFLFGEGKETPSEWLFVLSAGTYGTVEGSVEKGVKKYGRAGYVLHRLFPSLISMRGMYPVLKKCPMLYPVCWVSRAFRILFSKSSKAKMKKEFSLVGEKKK